jgi:L-amino acid N-acyltransferase YncA
MTNDARRELLDSSAPLYMNEVTVRPAGPEDAAGVAAVLNGVIAAGSPTLLDTTFTVDEERAYILSLPVRSFLHVAEAPGAGIVGFQTVIPWNTFVTTEHDHVATMGTYVDAAHRRRGVGAALARSSFAAALTLGYDKIFTDLRADNLDSLAYHLSLGFSIVGAARRHARVRGRDVDVLFIERFLKEG